MILVLVVLYQLSSSSVWLAQPNILSRRMFIITYLISLMIIPSVWSLCYVLWVKLLDLPYPMPFIGLAGYLPSMVSTFLCIIFSLPQSWSQESSFRLRRKFFQLVIMYTQVIFLTYFMLEWVFSLVNPSYQWIIAIFLPMLREGHNFIFSYLCSKSAGMKVKPRCYLLNIIFPI